MRRSNSSISARRRCVQLPELVDTGLDRKLLLLSGFPGPALHRKGGLQGTAVALHRSGFPRLAAYSVPPAGCTRRLDLALEGLRPLASCRAGRTPPRGRPAPRWRASFLGSWISSVAPGLTFPSLPLNDFTSCSARDSAAPQSGELHPLTLQAVLAPAPRARAAHSVRCSCPSHLPRSIRAGAPPRCFTSGRRVRSLPSDAPGATRCPASPFAASSAEHPFGRRYFSRDDSHAGPLRRILLARTRAGRRRGPAHHEHVRPGACSIHRGLISGSV